MVDSGEKGYRVVSTNAVRDPGWWAAISLQAERLTKRVHPRLLHQPGPQSSNTTPHSRWDNVDATIAHRARSRRAPKCTSGTPK